jgi:Zn-finger nucleic acid-binding protein
MKEVERRGVMIDVCPECKGIWLDKGELERLLALERQEQGYYEAEYQEKKPEHPPHYHHDYHDPYHPKKHKKHKSLLGEIFDIFD